MKIETLFHILTTITETTQAEFMHYDTVCERFGLDFGVAVENYINEFGMDDFSPYAFENAIVMAIENKLIYNYCEPHEYVDLFVVKENSVTFELRRPDTYEIFKDWDELLAYAQSVVANEEEED